MSSKLEKIMVIETDEGARARLVGLLQEAGYEVSAGRAPRESLRTVQVFGPDLVIVGAETAQLDCCDLLAELKGSPTSRNIRVILLASGGPAERTRGLDLGADEVLSRPWDSSELLARIRAQLRVKHTHDELREKAEIAEESQQTAHTAFEALAVTERISRHAFTFSRNLKVAVTTVVLIAAVLGSIFLVSYLRAQKETRRAYAAIAQLERRMSREHDLIERARRTREELERTEASSLGPQRQKLEQQSEELRARMATAGSEEIATLRHQLGETTARLRRLENEGKVAQMIIRSYASSVCLLHVVVAFRDQGTGRRLRYAGMDAQGEPVKDSQGNPIVVLEGSRPEVRIHVFGTGFLAAPGGRILTNRHVVEPWWKDNEFKALVPQGVEPVAVEMNAYFPGASRAFPVKIGKLSADADLAVVQGDLGDLKVKLLALDGRSGAAVSGQPVILLGYATGLDAILARAGEETVRAIATSSNGDPKQITAELARRNLIRPINTQGHIGDVLADKIVYDAQTTSGGSGGPLFNAEGKVIGVNYAILQGFGGSNFAIPIRYAEPLLSH